RRPVEGDETGVLHRLIYCWTGLMKKGTDAARSRGWMGPKIQRLRRVADDRIPSRLPSARLLPSRRADMRVNSHLPLALRSRIPFPTLPLDRPMRQRPSLLSAADLLSSRFLLRAGGGWAG